MITNNTEQTALKKFEELKEHLKQLGSVAVAFSSGVDSAFLLKTAHDVLGDNAIAITAHSPSFPRRELRESEDFCKKEGIKQIVVISDETKNEAFCKNPPDRCYICKLSLFKKILQSAKENNAKYVIEGSNTDDMGDYRPGLRAIAELKVLSPLREAGLSKEEIRFLSKKLELPTWDKPSFACLASRFAYGEEITEEKLDMVEEAEQLLLDMGFKQLRVRIHGKIARIEILPEDFPRLILSDNRIKIYAKLQELGFEYVTMDLKGYRTGSMNETLNLH